MSENLKPRDGADIEHVLAWALAGEKTLEIVGRGSKRAIGRPAQWDSTLDLSGLSGITLYEPAELVLSAKAGTPLPEINALIERSGQELAFEPMDYGRLLGTQPGSATIGGVLSANVSGPRRIKAGAARDHFLGVNAVSVHGGQSGNRVVVARIAKGIHVPVVQRELSTGAAFVLLAGLLGDRLVEGRLQR